MQNKYHALAAEVDEQDTHQIIVIGVAAIESHNGKLQRKHKKTMREKQFPQDLEKTIQIGAKLGRGKKMFKAEMVAPYGLDCNICAQALIDNDPCQGCNGPTMTAL